MSINKNEYHEVKKLLEEYGNADPKENTTKEWIRNALLQLLKQKDYQDVQMKEIAETANIGRRTLYRYFSSKDAIMRYAAEELMDDFAQKLLRNHAEGLGMVGEAYFEFWEEHMDTLLLLKKAHLLYFIEDDLPQLIMRVAGKTKYKDGKTALPSSEQYERMLYDFYFKIAGFWKLTLVWCEQPERKTPLEMSRIIQQILEQT